MADSRRNFDLEAAMWDDEPRRVQLAADLFRAISEEVTLTPSMEVLDFGCGTGLVTLQLATQTGRVTGVDSSQGMLDMLAGKVRSLQISNVTTERVDLERGDVLKGAFDLVVSTMTLHHVRDVPRLLKQFAGVLRTGGQLCIADLDPEDGEFHDNKEGVFHSGFERGSLRDMLSKAGFSELNDRSAAQIVKPDASGKMKTFTVFLMTGRRA